jgi:hypothetical protein
MKRATAVLFCSGLAVFLLSIPATKGQSAQDGVHAPSGNTSLILQSITIPAIPNAPFTATVTTVWTRPLDDGTTVSIHNHRIVARDSSGRTFQERKLFFPVSDVVNDHLNQTEFADPEAHTILICRPDERRCQLFDYLPPAAVAPPIPAGPLNGGRAFLTRVLLGNDSINGVEVVGTKETATINPDTQGNDRAISIVKEFWYSPELKINVIEKRQDPRSGNENFEVGDISLGEPDPRLFEQPSDYQMDRHAQVEPIGEVVTRHSRSGDLQVTMTDCPEFRRFKSSPART